MNALKLSWSQENEDIPPNYSAQVFFFVKGIVRSVCKANTSILEYEMIKNPNKLFFLTVLRNRNFPSLSVL